MPAESLLSLTFASGLYDRMVPLFAREVTPEGIDLTFVVNDDPTDLFTKTLGGTFDASEMSITHFARLTSQGNAPLVAIPVFPSRVFRHGLIVVSRAANIARPKDLEGKRVGVPDFGMTAAVWIRGHLQHEYGVDWTKIRWLQDPARNRSATAGGLSQERLPVTIEENHSGESLSALLEKGEIDAFIGADIPEAMRKSSAVKRLFPNYREIEKEYYRRTGIFPIMHTVVIRREIYEAHPFVARSLYDALCKSKDLTRAKMRYMGTLRYMVPWLIADLEEADEVFNGDPFAYGLDANRTTLSAFLTYLVEQGLVGRELSADELFVDVAAL